MASYSHTWDQVTEQIRHCNLPELDIPSSCTPYSRVNHMVLQVVLKTVSPSQILRESTGFELDVIRLVLRVIPQFRQGKLRLSRSIRIFPFDADKLASLCNTEFNSLQCDPSNWSFFVRARNRGSRSFAYLSVASLQHSAQRARG